MKYIAERRLLFSKKGSQKINEVIFKISEPFIVTEDTVSFPVDGIASGCRVEIEGMDEPGIDYFGMDALQAINIASDIEPLVKKLSDTYDFYWSTGESYFDE